MTVVNMAFRGGKGEFPPSLFKPDRMAEALAELIGREAPTGRRKYAERRWNLSPDEARAAAEGNASKATLDKIFRNGGWGSVLDLFGVFMGEQVDQHLERQRRAYADHASRLGAIVRDLRAPSDPGRHRASGLGAGHACVVGSEHRPMGAPADEGAE